MTTLRDAAQQALAALEQDNPSGRTATIQALRVALEGPDVPETDFGNMEPVYVAPSKDSTKTVAEPIGWLEAPHGEFRFNTQIKITLPPSALEWKIPLYAYSSTRK